MKLNGVIYFYVPKVSDFSDWKMLRSHLTHPTEGRVFLQIDDGRSWTIPFRSTTHLVSILNEVRVSKNGDLNFKAINQKSIRGEKIKDDRRCLRISIKDADPKTDPMKNARYQDGGVKLQEASGFCDESTGVFLLLDTKPNYRLRRVFFIDCFDAGIKLDKAFSTEVAKRIPLNIKGE